VCGLIASRSGLYSAQKYNFAFCFNVGVKLWEELSQRVFGNGVLKWVFGQEIEEVAGDKRKGRNAHQILFRL